MKMKRTQTILEMKAADAKKFLLKSSSFFSLSLPPYFTFDRLLQDVSTIIGSNDLVVFYDKDIKPQNVDLVNYKLYNNKDGKYAWRKMEIIHPAIYVNLVNVITSERNWTTIIDRLKSFQSFKTIKCISLPKESETNKSDLAETILDWWVQIEQESLKKALDFKYIMVTDISDCYSSIYTHSIAWAIHTKHVAKAQKGKMSLVGNKIDKAIQSMQNGQTNGIPQGSVLMDLIAELVLGYADELLFQKLSENKIKPIEYYILRYRDDYRIFANDSSVLERIGKHLSDVLLSLNFRMNSSKTFVSSDIIKSSVKPDKLEWNKIKQSTDVEIIDKETSMHQKQLLLLYSFSEKYPNSGSIMKALGTYYNKIKDFNNAPADIEQSISIVLEIAVKNPKCFAICFAIIGKLLSLFSKKNEAQTISKKIFKRVKELPNANYAEIWLYRALFKVFPDKISNLQTAQELYKETKNIWDSSWIDNGKPLFALMQTSKIIDEVKMKSIDSIIDTDEINPFEYET